MSEGVGSHLPTGHDGQLPRRLSLASAASIRSARPAASLHSRVLKFIGGAAIGSSGRDEFLVRQLVRVDHCRNRSGARNNRRFRTCFEAHRSSIPLHVRPIFHAERKMDAQLRVLLREVLHALSLIHI